MRRWLILLLAGLLILLVLFLLRSCTGCRPGSAVDYFPYQPGMVAEFEGKGNEFASFKIRVLYREDGKLEWRRDTGGTVLAEVFSLQTNQVTRIFREGEVYDDNKRLNQPPNTNEVVLQGPVQVGTTWTSGGATHKITSVSETVQAAGQTLTCVVVVESTTPQSTIRNYYHKQFGWVLSVFESEGTVVESRLKSLTGP